MSQPPGDRSRLRRTLGLRQVWRRGGQAPEPDSPQGPPGRDEEASSALDSNDRIRAEAPDDLETRRRADQLEREIKHREHERRS